MAAKVKTIVSNAVIEAHYLFTPMHGAVGRSFITTASICSAPVNFERDTGITIIYSAFLEINYTNTTNFCVINNIINHFMSW